MPAKGLNHMLKSDKQTFTFFGGKGGVGKTSSSAATAIHLADQGFRTLIISTDPAHSLGDALAQDISGGDMVDVTGMDNLVAMEIDAQAAIEEFQAALEGIDLVEAARNIGLPEDIIQNLGLKEMVLEFFETPPPGLDELVAIAKVVKLAKGEGENGQYFDRIVIDTAPTGHTLRLLAFPDFLDGFLQKVINLRAKIQGILNTFKGFFSDGGDNVIERTEQAIQKLEDFKHQMIALRELFHDAESTEFVIVTIATQLAVAESQRLFSTLKKENIAVRSIIVNQLVSADESETYMERLEMNQKTSVNEVEKWQQTSHPDLSITKVPYFDMEVVGVPALKYMGQVAFSKSKEWEELVHEQGDTEHLPKFVILGGKGGVGKTSSSSSLAVTFAEQGLNTVIVSTDPAHSLGDALQVDLTSGELIEVEGIFGDGKLFALEVDTEEAMSDFKSTVQAFAQDDSAILRQFSEFADVLDTAPPGTDELVALAKVLDLIKGKVGAHSGNVPKFDRVVIDTAPTGHTLRLLSFPDFLGDFFERLIRIRDRLKASSAVFNLVSQVVSKDSAFKSSNVGEAKDRLREVQLKMFELEELFRDEDQTEFVVVTIPTTLALEESKRLVDSLKEQEVAVRKIILNQLFSCSKETKGYFDRLSHSQANELEKLEKLADEKLKVTKVPYFDTEITSIYGLRAMGQVLFPIQ
eukprot:CAMPEP_0117791916 /NCGR_PEP_ID=MMETSP0948-20121206/9138_1 /TAXON_ID=44440 /ORGANISM="Chattonella subsalsa, Strain CCMP2191" /LENGTH=693 /DNA_ID=CAMNT_0005622053 /DNA_START=210 /DNA_END=2290 /DNA_ORIENTATION=+